MAYLQGKKYEEGDGVPQNLMMAVRWYRKSADEGCAEAMYRLGQMCEEGKLFKRNLQKAEMHYRKALAAGCALAEEAIDRVWKQRSKSASLGGAAKRIS